MMAHKTPVCLGRRWLRQGGGGKPESALRRDQGAPFHSHHAEIGQCRGTFLMTHQNGQRKRLAVTLTGNVSKCTGRIIHFIAICKDNSK